MASSKRRKKQEIELAETEQKQNPNPTAGSGYRLKFEPRSVRQLRIIKNVMNHDISFVIGPTGTGKTFLATVAALRCVYNRQSPINKIIVIRPAVTAQEEVGFLPGSVDDKMAYFVAPVYEHIIKLVGKEEFNHLMQKQVIEVIPIAFLRGRNFDNAFVILDEAQNTNKEQIFLVLTRIAQNSKVVVCGDPDQLDIYQHDSGLLDCVPRFQDNPNPRVYMCQMEEKDIVRHELVSYIVKIYHKDRPSPHNLVIDENQYDDTSMHTPESGIDLGQLDDGV